MRNMTDVEIGWVAGLLEGEGCFAMHIQKQHGPIYRAPRIQMSSTDEDVLLRLQEVTGIGRVMRRSPDRNQPETRKTVWAWQVTRKGGAVELMELIAPLMGKRRREKIQEVLDSFTDTGVLHR